MKKFFAVPCALAGALLILWLFASPASAQASRTWVSGVGDDVNPCSRTAPCKTFAGAISKTAVNGEINCLDPGGFGTVTITKSITIDCSDTLGSILSAGTNGVNIAFDSFAGTDVRKTVNLRHLSIQGFDSGIIGVRILGNGTGSFVNVEDCLINGNFGGAAIGLSDERTNGTLSVQKTTIRDMGAWGVSINSSGGLIRATLSDISIINANRGIGTGSGGLAIVTRSVLASNATAGLIASTGSGMDIDSSTIAHNGIGLQSSGTVSIANSLVTSNATGVSGTINSYTSNRFHNNGAGGTIAPIGTTSNPTGLQ